jgi:hypothetical protein
VVEALEKEESGRLIKAGEVLGEEPPPNVLP